MSTIQDTDLLLVNRGGVDYKITAKDLKEQQPTAPPPPWANRFPQYHLIVPVQSGPINIDYTRDMGKMYDMNTLKEVDGFIKEPGEYMACGINYNPFLQCYGTWDFGPLTNTYGISAHTMNHFMRGCAQFDGKFLGNWDFKLITDMEEAFTYCSSMTTAEGMSEWNVSTITEMDGMFASCAKFNADLSKWCVEQIPTKPEYFDAGANAWDDGRKPVWGTCPRGENQ